MVATSRSRQTAAPAAGPAATGMPGQADASPFHTTPSAGSGPDPSSTDTETLPMEPEARPLQATDHKQQQAAPSAHDPSVPQHTYATYTVPQETARKLLAGRAPPCSITIDVFAGGQALLQHVPCRVAYSCRCYRLHGARTKLPQQYHSWQVQQYSSTAEGAWQLHLQPPPPPQPPGSKAPKAGYRYSVPAPAAHQMLAGRQAPCEVSVDMIAEGAVLLRAAKCEITQYSRSFRLANGLSRLLPEQYRAWQVLRCEAPVAGGCWQVHLGPRVAGEGSGQGAVLQQQGQQQQQEERQEQQQMSAANMPERLQAGNRLSERGHQQQEQQQQQQGGSAEEEEGQQLQEQQQQQVEQLPRLRTDEAAPHLPAPGAVDAACHSAEVAAAVQHDALSASESSPDCVRVICNGVQATYLTQQQLMQLDDGTLLSPSAFERHAGQGVHKKWKKSVRQLLPDGQPGQQMCSWLAQHRLMRPCSGSKQRADTSGSKDGRDCSNFGSPLRAIQGTYRLRTGPAQALLAGREGPCDITVDVLSGDKVLLAALCCRVRPTAGRYGADLSGLSKHLPGRDWLLVDCKQAGGGGRWQMVVRPPGQQALQGSSEDDAGAGQGDLHGQDDQDEGGDDEDGNRRQHDAAQEAVQDAARREQQEREGSGSGQDLGAPLLESAGSGALPGALPLPCACCMRCTAAVLRAGRCMHVGVSALWSMTAGACAACGIVLWQHTACAAGHALYGCVALPADRHALLWQRYAMHTLTATASPTVTVTPTLPGLLTRSSPACRSARQRHAKHGHHALPLPNHTYEW